MPSSLTGLVLFVVLLIPGFIHYIQRRRRVPQSSLSPLVETATLVSVSVFTDLLAIGVFGLIRTFAPDHTPDVRRMFVEGLDYTAPRVAYIVAWAVCLLTISSALAVLLAVRLGFVQKLSDSATPIIRDIPAWYFVFESGPEGTSTFVGCDLRDGTYLSGQLDWYSTEVNEIADRDLVLARPITFYDPDGESQNVAFPRVIVSARDITRLYVSFIDPPTDAPEQD